jgi:hypothetical protein
VETDRSNEAMSLADLFAWTQNAIWDDPASRNVLHRNLQDRWTRLLVQLSLAPSDLLDHFGYPEETPAQARYQLSLLQPRLREALASKSLDGATRAHLANIAHQVEGALNARSVQGS